MVMVTAGRRLVVPTQPGVICVGNLSGAFTIQVGTVVASVVVVVTVVAVARVEFHNLVRLVAQTQPGGISVGNLSGASTIQVGTILASFCCCSYGCRCPK